VNSHASRLPRGVNVTVSEGVVTMAGAALGQIIRFTDDPVTGTLALGSVYVDTPGAITRSYQAGGIQSAEPYVLTSPAGAAALDPAPAYSFGFPGLPAGIVHSQAGMRTLAGSTAAPGTYSSLGVLATDQYGARAASVYQLVVHAHKVHVPGNYGDEVNRSGTASTSTVSTRRSTR
jgi:hypothetical protein